MNLNMYTRDAQQVALSFVINQTSAIELAVVKI